MHRIISLLILLTFTWTSIVQALPFSDDFHHQPTLASQAAISLAHNKGDILKAAESLTNSGTLKTVATDVAFAALLGAPSSGASIGTHVMHQMRNSVVRMGVEGAIHGKSDRKAWLKKAVINGFASFGASQVGALHRAAVIGQATHKIAHTFIGGMTES